VEVVFQSTATTSAATSTKSQEAANAVAQKIRADFGLESEDSDSSCVTLPEQPQPQQQQQSAVAAADKPLAAIVVEASRDAAVVESSAGK
jgi:hypothetical protein